MDKAGDIATTVLAFAMSIVSTVTGWFNSFFGAVIPTTTEGKSMFSKALFALAAGVILTKLFNVKLNVGGGKK